MSTDDSHRRIYARGFFDCARAAGVDTDGKSVADIIGELMNPAKHKSIIDGLSAVARKVFDSVPMNESWPSRFIMADLARRGLRPDRTVVDGCLQSLVSSGLIVEVSNGSYIRVPQKEKKQEKPTVQTVTKDSQKAPCEKPIDRLAAISQRASQLAESLKALASDIEEAAIEIEEQVGEAAAKADKLRALQELLKGLS